MRQSGSIAGFIIIGVVLVGALIGGVYYVRQQVTVDSSVATQKDQPVQEQKEEDTNLSKEDEAANLQADTAAPEVAQPTQTQEAATLPNASDNASESVIELPQTGSASVLGLVGVAALCGVGIAYFRSRRFIGAL